MNDFRTLPKFLVWSLMLIVGCLRIASAQTIPRGADAIELTTSMADSTLFESVQAYLEESGFDIDVANEAEGTIVTEYKVISEFKTRQKPVQLRILASFEEGIVQFRGQVKAEDNTAISGDKPIVYTGEETDGVFLLMNTIITRYAKKLDQVTVDYTVL